LVVVVFRLLAVFRFGAARRLAGDRRLELAVRLRFAAPFLAEARRLRLFAAFVRAPFLAAAL